MRIRLFLSAALSLLALQACAQVRIGEATSSANGTISSGYSAAYGNLSDSSHSWNVGGVASLSGAYFNPNFLSYNANVYLNQSRANSNFQSISNASGVNLSTNIFGGSKFPGSVSYTKAYDSEGNYSVPGLSNYVTHGNNDTFGVTWSENLTSVPNFSVSYQRGSSDYSVYGAGDEGSSLFHSLNLHSAYSLQGLNMSAYYTRGAAHSLVPESVTGSSASTIYSHNDAEGFNAAHQLPFHGSFTFGYNRSTWNSDYLGTSTSGTIDTLNTLAAIHPTSRIALSVSSNYSDNLAGQLIQSVVSSGGAVTSLNSDSTSSSLDVMTVASYSPAPNIQTSGYFERRSQELEGETYGVRSYGVGASYARRLLAGSLNTSVNFTANSSENTSSDSLGVTLNENYTNEYHGWNITQSFGYAQNAQTLLVTSTNSYYNYGLNARHTWGLFNLGLGAGGARTALSSSAGTSNSSQSYNANFGYSSWITATGTYSKADGEALNTGSGLVPITEPESDTLISLYGGNSYSFGLSSSIVKKLIIGASYAKSVSNIASSASTSNNNSSQFTTLVQYRFRKMSWISGYSRLEQGFSASGTQPQIVSSYYFGVSRWFNFF